MTCHGRVAVQWTPIHDMLDTDILCLSVGEQAGARKVIIQIWKAKLVRNRIFRAQSFEVCWAFG